MYYYHLFVNFFFQRLFSRGEFPDTWAKSVFKPLHKNGSLNNPNNYRGKALGMGGIYYGLYIDNY
jgi:hypothetical protein